MNFFIKKNSELPILKVELINDGINDFRKFHESIQNADITFTMRHYDTEQVKVSCMPCQLAHIIDNCDDNVVDEYYIVYKWRLKDTSKSGKFIGEFNIDFLDGTGTLKAPIKETLFIYIIE